MTQPPADAAGCCAVCGGELAGTPVASLFVEAGEWLAAEVWQDAGRLCGRCLESRAQLVMMYHHQLNR